ncbi:MAG: AraC family transcriptional regulator, partial [Bacteroidaceae bacterium]
NIVKIIVEQKKYLQNNYGAKDLCKELGVQPRYVSAVIRIALKTNYSGLINSHRIAMACDYLMDAQYARLTMEEIGLLVGYESRQAFYLAFKKIQKMSPRRYQETRRTKGIVDNEK